MEIPWAASSGVCMVMLWPDAGSSCFLAVPDTQQSASIRLLFPEPPWPRTATFLIFSVVYSFADAMKPPVGDGLSIRSDHEGFGDYGGARDAASRSEPHDGGGKPLP